MARVPKGPTTTQDILYETFYAGAIGGSVIALLFLLSDLAHGEPFLTPSVLGSTLLFGIPLEFVESMRLDAVAWFTAIHFAASGLLGLVGALLVRAMESHERRPMWVTLVLFGFMQAGYLIPLMIWAPDVPEALGYTRVAVINLAAAVATVAFLHHARTVEDVARAEARGERMDYDARDGVDRRSVLVPPFVRSREEDVGERQSRRI